MTAPPPPPETLTAEEYRALVVGRKPSKYRNEPTVVGGERFDSRAEAARWGELQLLQREGAIRALNRQVRFPLVVNGVKVAAYIADFVYEEAPGWGRVVEDKKGARTAIYRLKARLMLACHGIAIRET